MKNEVNGAIRADLQIVMHPQNLIARNFQSWQKYSNDMGPFFCCIFRPILDDFGFGPIFDQFWLVFYSLGHKVLTIGTGCQKEKD